MTSAGEEGLILIQSPWQTPRIFFLRPADPSTSPAAAPQHLGFRSIITLSSHSTITVAIRFDIIPQDLLTPLQTHPNPLPSLVVLHPRRAKVLVNPLLAL